MFIEIDPEAKETLNIAERLLSDTKAGKETIEEIKKKQKEKEKHGRRSK